VRARACAQDKEAIKKATMSLTEEEEQLMKAEVVLELKDEELKVYKVKGVVDKLTGMRRQNKQKEYEYQLKWIGKSDDANVYVPLNKLEKLGKLFMKLVKVVDEKIASMTGMYVRPLTREMVEKQLEDVGLEAEYGTHSRMGALSGGQKVRARRDATRGTAPVPLRRAVPGPPPRSLARSPPLCPRARNARSSPARRSRSCSRPRSGTSRTSCSSTSPPTTSTANRSARSRAPSRTTRAAS
jgi:hypothetical protein